MKRQLIPGKGPGHPSAQPLQSLRHGEWSAWLQLVSTFTLLPAALDSQLQRDAGMSHFEFEVMAALSRQPDRRLPVC